MFLSRFCYVGRRVSFGRMHFAPRFVIYNDMKVLKFGGTCMATPQSVLRVKEVCERYGGIAVVSAPGKRAPFDRKLTDLLFDCYERKLSAGRCDELFVAVEERILELAQGVGADGLKPYLDEIRQEINGGAGRGYAVSRGEFLSAKLLSRLLGWEFIDAAELIKFDMNGAPDMPSSFAHIKKRLSGLHRAVVGGYYGVMPNGVIRTFSRGGSDVTGAIIAAATGAEEYLNWTDVDGVYFCGKTELCSPLKKLSYREMRELAYFGAGVLHPDALPPLKEGAIPVKVKNLFRQSARGTTVCDVEISRKITALSGRGGFILINFYKLGAMDSGIPRRLVEIAERVGAKVLSVAGGVDSCTLVAETADKLRLIGAAGELSPDKIEAVYDLAIVDVVGKNEIVSAVSDCLRGGGVDIKYLSCDSFNIGITVGVDESDADSALTLLCRRFHESGDAM